MSTCRDDHARPLGPSSPIVSSWGLDRYVTAVAEALGIGAGGASWEVAEHASAYLALDQRHAGAPGRDLMLTWDEHDGWQVATEPAGATQEPVVLARLHGDVLPPPFTVAEFARAAAAGLVGDPDWPYQVPNPGVGPEGVADRLAAYHQPDGDGLQPCRERHAEGEAVVAAGGQRVSGREGV